MRVAIISPEVAPFVGGGIAPVTLATAQQLAGKGIDVDLFVPGHWRRDAARLRSLGMPAFRSARLHWRFVDPIDGDDPWVLRWARAIDQSMRTIYRSAPRPEVVEVQDYLGTGALALEAAVNGESPLSESRWVVRLHSTVEMVHAVDHHVLDEEAWSITYALERTTLRLADALLAPTSHVASIYEAFFGGDVGPATPLWPSFLHEGVGKPLLPERRSAEPLHVAYVGRMQAVKGVLPLVQALADIPDVALSLQLVGGDTETAPDAGSMLSYIAKIAQSDPRIEFQPARPRHELAAIVQHADIVVVPSRWECCPNVGLEALAANRPVLGSAVGALQDMLLDHPALRIDGDLRSTIGQNLHDLSSKRDELRALTASGAPRARFDALVDADVFEAGYRALAGRDVVRAPRPGFDEILDQVHERGRQHASPSERAEAALSALPAGSILS